MRRKGLGQSCWTLENLFHCTNPGKVYRQWEKRKSRIKTLLPFIYICLNIGSPGFRPIINPPNVNRNLGLSERCWQNTIRGRNIGGKLGVNFSHSPSVAVRVTLKKMFLDLSCGNILKHSVLTYPPLHIDLAVCKGMHLTLKKIHFYVYEEGIIHFCLFIYLPKNFL